MAIAALVPSGVATVTGLSRSFGIFLAGLTVSTWGDALYTFALP